MTAGNIDQLHFEVILNDKTFNEKVDKDIEQANRLNLSLSSLLNVKSKLAPVAQKVAAANEKMAQASAKNAEQKRKESESFSKYVEQLRKMEAEGQKAAETMPKAFNWTHHINQSYLELNRVMETLQKIQERKESGARIQYSDEYINKITAAGEAALRSINALEQAQKRLTAPNNGFQEHIRNLTTVSTKSLQMREHYLALEKDTKRAAEETKKMYAAQKSVTGEVKRTATVSKDWEAAQRRIAENLEREKNELPQSIKNRQLIEKAVKKTADNQQRMNALIAEGTKKQEEHAVAVEKSRMSLTTLRSVMSTISALTGVYFGATGIRRFVESMIRITGEFEFQKVALKTILRDAEAGERIFEQLYKFSGDSMYRFSELAKYSKQLAAFGIGENKLLETTKMLGDVAAGLGTSMDRLILAYGHVKTSGFLRGIQLRSFSQNGVPILERLAEILSEAEGKAVSLGEVFDRMTKRQIDFAMVEEAFRRMTAEGGEFYQMQEKGARTLKGEINVMKGRWENLMNEMGEQTSGFIIAFVREISNAISSLDKFKSSLEDIWDAGSPLWTFIHTIRDIPSDIRNARAGKGKGGSTGENGGGGFLGGGTGGGSRDETNKQIQGYIKISNIVNQIKTEEAEIARLQKKAKTEGLVTGLKDEVDEMQLLNNAIESRDQALKQYKDIMGEDYYKQRKAGAKAAKDEENQVVKSIKNEISILRKYKDAYDELLPYVGEERIADVLGEIFRVDFKGRDLAEEITLLAESLRGFGESDFADQVQTALGTDIVSKKKKEYKDAADAAKDATKSLNDYINALQEWADKNQELSGTGAAFNVSKSIATYRKAIAEATKRGKEALKDLIYGTTDADARMAGYASINGQFAKSKANALVVLRQDLTKYADDIMKEQLEGYDLTDWNDKTLSQINDIKQAIESVEVPEEIKALLVDFPDLLKALEEELAKLKQAKIDKTVDPERWKKVAKQAKYIAERFVEVSAAMKEYADATGNAKLSQAADAVGRVAQNLKAAEEGYKAWGGWWGAVIGGASDLIQQVLGAITETEQEATALKDTLRDIASDSAIKQFADDIKKAGESIFGGSSLSSTQKAIDMLKEAGDALANIGGLGGGERRGSVLTTQGTYNGVEFTRKAENLFNLAERWGLEKIAEETGKKILGDYGEFNVELLKWIQEAGWDLTEAEKEWLKEAIVASTNYAEAMKTIEETAKSILDNTVSDVADKMVDSWWEAGQAALDYADILGDVAKAYAKLIVQDLLLDAAFDGPRRQAFIDALKSGDTATAMAVVEEAMMAAQDMLPTVQSALEAFEPYRQMASDSSNSVGSGIKGITEDTANLLASYINAIRSDVSVMRGIQEKTLPTLNDYLSKVAANTYDAARAAEAIYERQGSILSALGDVIGSEDSSGLVVRVRAV